MTRSAIIHRTSALNHTNNVECAEVLENKLKFKWVKYLKSNIKIEKEDNVGIEIKRLCQKYFFN